MRFSSLFWVIVIPAAAGTIEFNRDVRPILSDKCFTCHGPDAAAKKIPLRLDSEDAVRRDLGGGKHAVIPGKPSESQMMLRVMSEKPSLRMPPVYSGLKLTPAEVETLRAWIEQGAAWQKHWSLIPPRRYPLPAVKNAAWARNPIDAFVLARLEKDGLAPAAEASREVLIRRVSLDLTGVPPTPEEVAVFVNDRSANAYEKVVDRLLASTRYGERLAARWLDAARYADTNGYQYDGERQMWRWRDWVIEAFNRNQPFDQFMVDQIAGDMLPNATLDQKMATGFNRNHRANTEDGIVAEEYAVEYVVDRVETTSTVFLGMTLGCARCHNHKYDPFTQKEFYQFYAYFNNIPELGRAMKYGNSPPLIAAPTHEQQRESKALDGRIQEVEQFLKQRDVQLAKSQTVWESGLKQEVVYWAPRVSLDQAYPMDAAEGTVIVKPGRIGMAGVFDGKAFLDVGTTAGFYDITDRYTISAWVYGDTLPEGTVFSRMADSARGKGYGLSIDNGKVHVHITSVFDSDAIKLDTEESLTAGRWHHLAMAYTGSRMAEGITVYIDGKAATLKVTQDNLYRPFNNAGSKYKQQFRIGAGGGPEKRFRGLIDDVRLYSRVLSLDEIAELALGESIPEIAKKAVALRSATEVRALRNYFLENAAPADVRAAAGKLAALRLDREKMERTFPTVMVMSERPVLNPTHLLVRGAYNAPGDVVEPGLPAVLPAMRPGTPNNRLGLAKWLADPQNPLPARVTVNRFWQSYFGTGLVKTTEDFGVQGEWPSHPELLDWLATEFVGTGWDVKGMQKLIVMSATYRQSSKASPALLQKDPENRLLARGSRQRLPAETIRDQALAVAGLLTDELGGPSIKPYQPAGLWKDLSMQDMDYVQSKAPDLYRRSMYIFWKRTIAPPMMANFDSAMRESCVVRETRTNTPLQALNLMNDVTFVEAARFVGQRMMKEGGGTPDGRLGYGYRLVTGKTASRQAIQVLHDSLQYHLDYFSGKQGDIDSFLKQGDAPPDPALDRRELAAYSAVGSLLLNLDETVTKE